MKNSNAPPCSRTACFAYAGGKCRVLTDSSFNRDCPFFKEAGAKKAEDERCKERVILWKESRKEKKSKNI